MYHIALATIVLTSAAGELSDECSALGVEDAVLTQDFCDELRHIAEPHGTTRKLPWGTPEEGEAEGADGLTGIGVIDRAYRADPRKTLELIQRIKGAGGLTGTTN